MLDVTPDEKRRLYVLMDRAPRYDATVIWFWIAIGVAGWGLLAGLGWSIWTLFKFFAGGNS